MHRLAIEDLLNPKNRTKADWYSDHTYMVLPLQKLIHFHSDEHCDSDCEEWDDEDRSRNSQKSKSNIPFLSSFRRMKNEKTAKEPPKPLDTAAEMHPPTNGFVTSRNGFANVNGFVKVHSSSLKDTQVSRVRTLQRYHGGPNEERIEFMEKHSALASKGLGVGVEQVSIFLISDNTVISFFETSAQDIETPIVCRLSSRETILRRSSDASMVTQVSVAHACHHAQVVSPTPSACSGLALSSRRHDNLPLTLCSTVFCPLFESLPPLYPLIWCGRP